MCLLWTLFSWWVVRGSEDAFPMDSLLFSPSLPPSSFVVLPSHPAGPCCTVPGGVQFTLPQERHFPLPRDIPVWGFSMLYFKLLLASIVLVCCFLLAGLIPGKVCRPETCSGTVE